jgi:hypothetical protein
MAHDTIGVWPEEGIEVQKTVMLAVNHSERSAVQG